MSVTLSYYGAFDPEQLLRDVDLDADRTWRRGDPRGRENVHEDDGIRFFISDAPFDQFEMMVKDTVEFLREYGPELHQLRQKHGVEDARIDFGSAQQKIPAYERHFPHELIAQAAESGLSIDLSLYAVTGKGGFEDVSAASEPRGADDRD